MNWGGYSRLFWRFERWFGSLAELSAMNAVSVQFVHGEYRMSGEERLHVDPSLDDLTINQGIYANYLVACSSIGQPKPMT
ncbi:MAG: hypothetical protein IT445_15345 [Phycisphaeraceae bacterium]|nr:hypothetical protein [Phycisphaeraceae bacterium]